MAFLKEELFKDIMTETVGERYELAYPYGGRFENVISVDEISRCRIVFTVRNGKMILTGENLSIRSYCGTDVTVKGKITVVERK